MLGTVREVATPLRLDGFEPPVARAPFRGEDTASVLRDLCGYTDAGIAELVRDGVFGEVPRETEVVS